MLFTELCMHLGYIILLKVQLGQLGMGGVVALAPCKAGPSLGLEQVQEGSISARPPIQTAEVSGACTVIYMTAFRLLMSVAPALSCTCTVIYMTGFRLLKSVAPAPLCT